MEEKDSRRQRIAAGAPSLPSVMTRHCQRRNNLSDSNKGRDGFLGYARLAVAGVCITKRGDGERAAFYLFCSHPDDQDGYDYNIVGALAAGQFRCDKQKRR